MEHGKALRLGSIGGIPIKAERSLIVVFALVTWSLASVALPELSPGYTAVHYWGAAAVIAVAFLASLLAHELSHSIVARRRGIAVRDITLWLLGGVSRIEDEPANPSDDLRIALAGPATSFAIALGAFVGGGILAVAGAPDLVVSSLLWLASINVVLGLFNLVPAAPLDGGRMLRAFLWRRRGDRTSAAISATRAGRVFAYVLVAAGFAEFLFLASASGIWLVLLGWYLLAASRAEEMQFRLERDLAGVRVCEIMTADPITVAGDLSAEQVLHEYVLARRCSSFPVVDGSGRVVGLVTLHHIRAVPPVQRATTSVREIATPIASVARAEPDELVLTVLRRIRPGDDGRVLVFTGDRLVGIVSATDVARAFQIAELASTH